MTDLVPVPHSKTDEYAPEPTNVAPVLVRLTHLDGSTTDLRESADVLKMPLFLLGGRLYVRRGADGARHLYREVPEVPRLDVAATRSEEVAFVSGMLEAVKIMDDAAGEFTVARVRSRAAAFAAVVGAVKAGAAARGYKP